MVGTLSLSEWVAVVVVIIAAALLIADYVKGSRYHF